MGAKQSKRSVDISGKEAESAGEVAAAGGEGRVEPLADADTLKAQLNGDAQHIQPIDDITEKEKQLDSGTPENEKDATTEKELKEESNETEAAVVNGSEEKTEHKESAEAPTPDQEGKKPKKEKVKKKWSLRSISFSRKDKPKQEKKLKDEEPKANGEPDQLPEEAAEMTAESVEVKPVESTEAKEDKTPETPVTEPLTNGSSTPESPAATLAAPATAPAASPAALATAPAAPAASPAPATEPEQLPLNGLSLETKTEEVLAKVEPVESIAEEKPAEPIEVPAPEITLKTEVCVEQVPLVESTPPPLPDTPPPPRVASFAANTMAPAPPSPPSSPPAPPSPPAPETPAANSVPSTETVETDSLPSPPPEMEVHRTDESVEEECKLNGDDAELPAPLDDHCQPEVTETEKDTEMASEQLAETVPSPPPVNDNAADLIRGIEHVSIENGTSETSSESLANSNHLLNGDDVAEMEEPKSNGDASETEHENIKNKTKDLIVNTEGKECNGNAEHELTPEELSASLSAPLADIVKEAVSAVADMTAPPSIQDAVPVHDKIADLIPEVPDLPTECPAETSDVAVVN